MSNDRFRELAQRLADRTAELEAQQGRGRAPARPTLRVVPSAPPPPPPMCAVTRESHIRIIRHHRRFYSLQWLVDQACFGYAGLEHLPDDELVQLHKDIDRARECIADGVSFEDAGLIRACA